MILKRFNIKRFNIKKLNVLNVVLIFILLSLFFISCNESEFSSSKPSGCEDGLCDDVSSQSFNWKEGDWTSCSRACGGGVHIRRVSCIDGKKNTVLDSECASKKPIDQESCNTQDCVSDFSWNIGPWGNCDKPCNGKRIRVVNCQYNLSGAAVIDSKCAETKPAIRESCNTTCPPESFQWVLGAYDRACACGVSEITREVTCRSTTTDAIQDDSSCDAATKPETVTTCPQDSCSTYSWVTGQYSTCTKKCDNGIQTRSISCIRNSDAVYVSHTLCKTSEKPQTQRACNTQACAPQCTKKTFTKKVKKYDNQLDILLVIDDSGSMYKDSSRLATKLKTFVDRLKNSNINWQMCVTTTDTEYYQGRPIQWQGGNSEHILKKNSGNLNQIFVDTIRFIGAGFSSDEQGIKAMSLSVQDNDRSDCYRDKAALSVIVISDEDERSVGGNKSLSPKDYKPLGPLNTPQSFIKTVKNSFSPRKRLTVNSIVIKDDSCQEQQEAQGERAFFGRQYMDLSHRTNGVIQSICLKDYTIALNRIYQRICNSLNTITLSCVPKDRPTVTVDGEDYAPYVTISGKQLIFNPAIQGPATVSGGYCCRQ